MIKLSRFKILIITFSIVLMFGVTNTAYAERPIKIIVGGEYIGTDVYPIIINDRVLLPVRTLFEAIGADVSYVAEERKVSVNRNGNTVEFEIGSNIICVNGTEVEMDVPATEISGRTFAPVRACAEAFGLQVEWNDSTKTVKVLKPCSLVVEQSGYYIDGIVKYQYDEYGNCISENNIIDDTDNITEYVYDESGNPVLVNYLTEGWGWKYTYNDYGEKIYEEAWKETPERRGGYRGKYEYDDSGRITSYEMENYVTGQTISATVTYDEYGNAYEKRSDGIIEIKKYWVDNRVREHHIEEPDGSWTKEIYDEGGKRISLETSDGYLQKYTYNERGNLLSEEDGKGNRTQYRYEYNEFGKVTLCEWTHIYNNKKGNSDYEKYVYDKKGNIIYTESGSAYPEGIVVGVDGSYRPYNGTDTNVEVVYNKPYEWTNYTYDSDNNLIYEENYTDYEKIRRSYKKYIVIVK